jgi:hypothetical protein
MSQPNLSKSAFVFVLREVERYRAKDALSSLAFQVVGFYGFTQFFKRFIIRFRINGGPCWHKFDEKDAFPVPEDSFHNFSGRLRHFKFPFLGENECLHSIYCCFDSGVKW